MPTVTLRPWLASSRSWLMSCWWVSPCPAWAQRPQARAAGAGGQLTLDFGAQNFATQLQLSSQATGAQTLQAAGSLNHEGIFIQRQPGLNVGGAVALDGKTAGYFFEQAFGTGNLSGITLWGR